MDRFDAQRFESLAKCRIRYGATPIYVTEGMYLFWSVDYSLRQMFDPEKPDDVFAFYVWWWLHLRELYPHVPFPYGPEQRAFLHAPVGGGSWADDRERLSASNLLAVLHRLRGDWAHLDLSDTTDRCNIWTAFFAENADLLREDRFAWDTAAAKITIPCGGEGIALPRALLIVLALRPDLQAAFPLQTAGGQRGLWHWGRVHGRRDFAILDLIIETPQQRAFLHAPSGGGTWAEDGEKLSVSNYLAMLYRERGDWAHLDPMRKVDRCNLWAAFFDESIDLLRRDRFAWDTAVTEITIPCDGVPTSLPRALLIVWNLRPDLQKAFPLYEAMGQAGLHRWWREHGRREFAFLRVIADEEGPAPEITEREQSAFSPSDLPFGRTEPGGVNVVGFAAGELGIGEDVRMAIRSLTAAAIPAVAYNVPLHLQSRAHDRRVADYLRDEPVYDTNFFALPGMETLRLYATHGSGLFQDRVNIGLWPWELPRWPEELIPALSLMQEMWANSRYIQETMAPVCPCPVIHMPLAVEIPDVPEADRSEFGLPADRYLFLFVFDGLSWPSRKNPLGTIRAFQSAFGTRKEVRLVVKAMNLDARYSQVREFLELAAVDDRVIQIDATLDRDKLLRLFQCCDAYVSLHRAEGFGRTIAEAMLLGKPCIVTNFSGNTDFCLEDTAFLVNGPLVPLQKADYFYTKDQYWCEPDIGEAAQQMRRCFEDGAGAQAKGDNARRLILEQHSPRIVGERYRARLAALGLL